MGDNDILFQLISRVSAVETRLDNIIERLDEMKSDVSKLKSNDSISITASIKAFISKNIWPIIIALVSLYAVFGIDKVFSALGIDKYIKK